MSVPTLKQAYAFLSPLRGRSSAFLVADRKANTAITAFALGCLAALRMRTVMLDTSCFYGTNMEVLAESLPREYLERTTTLTVAEDTGLENVLTQLMTERTKAVLIDDLNSLNALMSSGYQESSIHKMFVLIRMLSYGARMNNTLILATVYRSQRADTNSRRSLAAATDLQITTEAQPSGITFSCDAANTWPRGKFVAPSIYLAFKT